MPSQCQSGALQSSQVPCQPDILLPCVLTNCGLWWPDKLGWTTESRPYRILRLAINTLVRMLPLLDRSMGFFHLQRMLFTLPQDCLLIHQCGSILRCQAATSRDRWSLTYVTESLPGRNGFHVLTVVPDVDRWCIKEKIPSRQQYLIFFNLLYLPVWYSE